MIAMIYLTTTSDVLRVITSTAVATDVHVSWVDMTATAATPGRTNTAISTATTQTVVGSPAASTTRMVREMTIRNKHASSTQDVTVVHFDGATAVELHKTTLAAGDCLHYYEHGGFQALDNQGNVKQRTTPVGAVTSAINLVVLASDVINNNAVANTIADVTGLSFAVTANQTYWFEFIIPYTAAATTTGSRWSINGPASPTQLSYRSEYTLTATTQTTNSANTYDTPAAASASSLTVGNVATIWGIIQPSSNGTVIARFASEVLSSAITAKAGATLRWVRVA